MQNDRPPSPEDQHWPIQYSAFAFLLLVLWQCFGVVTSVPKFPDLFRGFGADLPPTTTFVLEYYWLGCLLATALSVASAGYLIQRAGGKTIHLKIAYVMSLVALVGSFVWSGFVNSALFAPILSLGAAV